MKRKCKRCLGTKTYNNTCCVKCGGKGYEDEFDLKLFAILKPKKIRKHVSLTNPQHIELNIKTLTVKR